MGFSLLPQNARELWKEWEPRLLILLSLFLQLTLATQGSRRKSISSKLFLFLVRTTYILAESIATLTLGVLSNRLANIKEMKGTFDPKSQITAFWASFLLLHLGGPDIITAFTLVDNELWPGQLSRLCVQVGLACCIYYTALSGSTLSLIAKGMILVGFIKYAEKTLCLFLASKDRLQNSMRSLSQSGPIYPRQMEEYNLKKEEGYQVRFEEVIEFSVLEGLSASGQASDDEKTLVKAYELFKIFKQLFMGLIINSGDLDTSKRVFMDLNSETAFKIMEIELGFMYDLLYTKAQLLNRAWGIIRWVVSLSVPCAVLVLFSLQDTKDYPKVDICITFLLVSVTILLEIYALLLALSSDWVYCWWLEKSKRSTISSAIIFLRFFPQKRWRNSVAQFSLLRFSTRKGNRIFRKCPWLARLVKKVEKYFYIGQKEFRNNFQEWIFSHMQKTVRDPKSNPTSRSKSLLDSFKLGASEVLTASSCSQLTWSVEVEFDRSILIWHIATELCYYKDRGNNEILEDILSFKMSKLVSRYMLYLLVFHPSMLPTGSGPLQYEDTLVDAQKFLEDKQAVLSKKEGCISSVIQWAHKLFKKEEFGHPVDYGCNKAHKSRELLDLCKVCHLLLQVETHRHLPAWKMRGDNSTSVLFDACHLMSQLTEVPRKWSVIGKVWARILMSAAYQSSYEHCESLSRGGELLSHVWLLMAHFGIAPSELTPGAKRITKLIVN